MRGGSGNERECFPTGRHYPGIADLIARSVLKVRGAAEEFDIQGDWRGIPLAVIDFETTGLDPANDRILEMGIVLFRNGELEEKRNWLINPTIPVPIESSQIHGIKDADLVNAPVFEQVVEEMLAILSGRLPVAYNASFDQRFLLAEFARVAERFPGEKPPALRNDVSWIDPLVWARELYKYEKGGKKLVTICEKLGIEIGQAHRAADDATATGKVLAAFATDLPATYGELVRIQTQYAAQQEADFAAWRRRK